MTGRFRGFPPEALSFYAGLEADNTKAYWTARKAVYDTAVRAPMEALIAEVDERYRPLRVFRPHRDVRFSPDKTPYKTHAGALGEDEGGAIYYVQLSAAGLMAAAGFYAMASDQLARFRAAVLDDDRGVALAGLVSAAERAGYEAVAVGALKTAPRGVPRDHPRIELLRRKGLALGWRWPAAAWLHTAAARRRVEQAWAGTEAVNDWLRTNVGPCELAPEAAWG